MNRKRFLVTYDVSDDKRRNQIFKTLYAYGDHAQYSVFFCELNAREYAELYGRLGRSLHHQEDQILILDLGSVANPLDAGLQCLGRPYRPATPVLVV
ncbi:MAG: CRISPR-associated endonuclease Cas2 [Acidobacteriota bacterium]|nr:MAG: CRISPR-associated endonuclease Cas2 [Acidobacteriota bacterium]